MQEGTGPEDADRPGSCTRPIGPRPASVWVTAMGRFCYLRPFEDVLDAAAKRELDSRDPAWVKSLKPSTLSLETEALREEIELYRPHELIVSSHLRKQGIPTHFVVDHLSENDSTKGYTQSVGLPDLAGGIELKALLGASGKSAIDRVLRDAGHKRGIKTCVIDNSWKKLPDGIALAKIMLRMGKRGVPEVCLIDSLEHMHRIAL